MHTNFEKQINKYIIKTIEHVNLKNILGKWKQITNQCIKNESFMNVGEKKSEILKFKKINIWKGVKKKYLDFAKALLYTLE